MLIATASQVPFEDPLRGLTTFHRRLRASLALLEGLTGAGRFDDDDRDRAAYLAELLRGPLSWHEEDEEELILPRLRGVRHSVRLERALDVIDEGHRTVDMVIDPVLPHLDEIACHGALDDAPLFIAAVDALVRHVEPHLRVEDQELLPLARLLLSDEDLEQIARELRGRSARRREGDDAELL